MTTINRFKEIRKEIKPNIEECSNDESGGVNPETASLIAAILTLTEAIYKTNKEPHTETP